ncbi:MAG: FtsX-like permease family protein [Lysobacterales bacterium]
MVGRVWQRLGRDRPLLLKGARELWQLRGQVLAIMLVVAAGVATFLMAISTYASLQATRASFYRSQHFADAFVQLTRAPERLARSLAEIPGVRVLETRVAGGGQLRIEGFDDPVRAWLVSLPERGEGQLNRLYLRQGRLPVEGGRGEVVVGEAFASAHGLRPGDPLPAIIRGRAQTLRVVGVGISPEFVYQIQAGAAFPDFKRFGVLWMRREALAEALELDQAFNHLAIALVDPERDGPAVLAELDRQLQPYGGRGAYLRADQLSHKFLSVEFDQLRALATVFPGVFLGVAAFLLHVVFGRMIAAQRETIGVLRAFGLPRRRLLLHYCGMVAAVVVLGVLPGLLGGLWLGRQLGAVYLDFYRFPALSWQLPPLAVLAAFVIALLAGMAGAWSSLRQAARIEPAEAMRPPIPPSFRRGLLERTLLRPFRSLLLRMSLRQLLQRPWKTVLTLLGIALASAVLTLGLFQTDALFYMVDRQFAYGLRNDLQVVFADARHPQVLDELRRLPGVERVIGIRYEPVRLVHHGVRRRVSLEAWSQDPAGPAALDLKRILLGDDQLGAMPSGGLVLTDALAASLAVRPGETIWVERLEGDRRQFAAPIVGLARESIGSSAYASAEWLDRALGDGPRVSAAALRLRPDADPQALYDRLEARPAVIAIGQRSAAIENFYDTMAESMDIFTRVSFGLAALIAFGVLYNTVRIAYAERERELATLRVLGLRAGEVSQLLIADLALLTVLSLPLGALTGWSMAKLLSLGLQSELYRVPAYLSPATFASATSVVLLAAVVAAIVIHRRVLRLAPLAALGSRE